MHEAGIHYHLNTGITVIFSVPAHETSIKEVGTQVEWGEEGTVAFKRDLGSMSLHGFTEDQPLAGKVFPLIGLAQVKRHQNQHSWDGSTSSAAWFQPNPALASPLSSLVAAFSH